MKRGAMPSACTIAGSDSGGGAGIQADLKTFTALGVWGCTVITAVTAQNPREVRGSWTLEPGAVKMQFEAVLDEFSLSAIKTGMLADSAIIEAVSEVLPNTIPLVIDPVMISTSGYPLLDEPGIEALRSLLLPRATLVTPNIPEAIELSGMDGITSTDEMIAAGERIRILGAAAVLVKGGHGASQKAVDVLVDSEGFATFEGPRYDYPVHGSGCCLSAAIAGFLAKNEPLREACGHAKGFIDAAIREAAVSRSGMHMVQPNIFSQK